MSTAELMPKIIAALEGGNYKQGQTSLKYVNREGDTCYCIDGVILDVIDPKGWHLQGGEYYWRSSKYSGLEIRGYLEGTEYQELGFDMPLHGPHSTGCSDPLFRLNDTGWTFAKFAQYFKKRYL